MTRQEMRDFAIGQVEWYINQNEWLTRQIERINNRLKQTRKEDKEQKEFAQTYEGGKYAHLYGSNYQGNETRKLINERRRNQRKLKKNAASIEHYKREVEKYTDPADKPQAATQAAEGTTHDEQKEEDHTMSTTANELQKYVDGIAADLRRLYEANPTDEEREAAEENGDAYDLYSYFTDVLDIEYTISSSGDYLGARIAVALGGPNIYIDTREGEVKGYWGTDREEAWISSEICDEINSIMEEYYDMVRGA